MLIISTNQPCLYLTSVAKDRLPVFRTDVVKSIVCSALHEARQSAGLLLFGYVIMPDHLHLITDSRRKPADVLRITNGIIAKRVIDYLKQKDCRRSLEKLRHSERARRYRYSLWQHHPNIKLLSTEELFLRRIHYTHQNPVRAGLVESAEDYRWSSVRCWKKRPLDDEPLLMDLDQIIFRKGRGAASPGFKRRWN